jgi:hypothetical protein
MDWLLIVDHADRKRELSPDSLRKLRNSAKRRGRQAGN